MRRRARGRSRPLPLLAAACAVLASSLAAGFFPAASAQVTASRGAPAAVRAAAVPDVTANAALNAAQAALAQAETAVQGASQAAAAAQLIYTVRPGDSLSALAQARCGTARDWTGIYAASRAMGWTARDPGTLTPGQHLLLSCVYVPSMLSRANPPAPRLAAAWSPPVQAAASYSGSYYGSGSMQQCIIARESGGNSQVMNSSGHYGLYQFSYSTWVASGGSPASFGNASVAEQNQVFYNAVAARGYSDWTPYDGC